MDFIDLERDGAIGIIKINRPDALNALNVQVLQELIHAITLLDGCRVAILTGAGEKAFVAGADIKAMRQMAPAETLEFCRLGQAATIALEQSPMVVIGAVNGFALGGGLELALSCDFVYLSEKAKVGLPEVSLGIIPGFGGTQRLTRAVGTRMAKELIATGRMIRAEEALRIGLANRVCSPEKLLEECHATAKEILAQGPFAVQQALNAVHRSEELALADGLELERQMFAVCFGSPDREEGMDAFLEKRKPNFNTEVVHAG